MRPEPWLVLALVLLPNAVSAAPGPVVAKAQCERLGTPGRVRCELELRVESGATIRWGDIEVLKAPPFARALKGRIGPNDATTREDEVWRWSFALVAREPGAGDLELRVRAVICRLDRCEPLQLPAVARVQVGTE